MKTFCKDCLPSRSVHRPVHKSVLTMSTAAHYAIWRAQLIALNNLWPHRWQERATVKHCGKEPWKPREGRGTLLGTEDERTVWTETGFELQPEASEAVNHVERENMSGIIIHGYRQREIEAHVWDHLKVLHGCALQGMVGVAREEPRVAGPWVLYWGMWASSIEA